MAQSNRFNLRDCTNQATVVWQTQAPMCGARNVCDISFHIAKQKGGLAAAFCLLSLP
jgi:hypothetical protein